MLHSCVLGVCALWEERSVCGEATGSRPKGGGVCTQQMGAGGGGTDEPSEWKTPVLRMALSSACHGGVSAARMG